MNDINDILGERAKKLLGGASFQEYFESRGFEKYKSYGWLKIQNVKQAVEWGWIKVRKDEEGVKDIYIIADEVLKKEAKHKDDTETQLACNADDIFSFLSTGNPPEGFKAKQPSNSSTSKIIHRDSKTEIHEMTNEDGEKIKYKLYNKVSDVFTGMVEDENDKST